MKCPKCGSTNIFTTLMGYTYIKDPGPNRNRSRCGECGEVGIADDWGADKIAPLRGTENFTDKEAEEWKENFRKNPIICENVGIGICNTKAIQRIKVEE